MPEQTPPASPFALATAIVPAVPAVILLFRFAFSAGEAFSLLLHIVMFAALLSYLGWIVVALPILFALRNTPLYHPIPIVAAGAICGFLVIPLGSLAFNFYRPPPAEMWWAVTSCVLAAVLFVIIARVPFSRPVKQPVRDTTIQQ
jgi:hypothetical protein